MRVFSLHYWLLEQVGLFTSSLSTHTTNAAYTDTHIVHPYIYDTLQYDENYGFSVNKVVFALQELEVPKREAP